MKLEEALTFDDVLIRPGYSKILPRDVKTNTKFSRDIKINIPLVAESDVNTTNPLFKIFAAIKYLIFGTSLDEI